MKDIRTKGRHLIICRENEARAISGTILKIKGTAMEKMTRQLLMIPTLLLCIILCSCQSTVINTSWRDSNFNTESLQMVFIVSHLKNELLRRRAEDTFTKELKINGINSLQSYMFFEKERATEKGEVARRIKQEGCTSVLVAKLLEKNIERVDSYNACFSPNDWSSFGWYTYYNQACGMSSYNVEILRIETALFDAETDKLLWATQTYSELDSDPTDQDIKDWVKLVVKSLLSK